MIMLFFISGNMCNKVLEVLEKSHGVIIEHAITSERIYNQLIEILGKYNFIFVHVTCPLDILKNREKERQNRCIGSAEVSYSYLFPKTGYDYHA